MEKKKRIIAGVLLIIVLSASFYWVYQKYLIPKSVVLEATGTIEATTVVINARTAGVIKDISANAGDSVIKGQIIAELTRNDLVAQVERDRLSVLKAEANLNDMLSGARQQERLEAAANVEIARVEAKRANDDLIRMRALLEAGAVSDVDYEKVVAVSEIAKNKLNAAEARLSLLDEGSRPEQLTAARMEIERSKAVLLAGEAALEDLKMSSPLDGVVLNKNYEAGEFVPIGASLLNIANLQDLWIKVYIATDDLPQVKIGQKVSFTVSGLEQKFEGTVGEIAGKGEFTPKTIQTKKERTNVVFGVKINISPAGGVLKPGMPADVVFSGGQ